MTAAFVGRYGLLATACAAAAGAALAASSAASPALGALVSRCQLDARAAAAQLRVDVQSLDPSFEFTARDLASRSAECATSLDRLSPTGAAACARTVAMRGLRSYRRGGEAFARAEVKRIRRRSNAPAVPPEVLRGEALVDAGAEQLAAAREVLAGHRGCANGTAARRALRSTTQQLLPGLARRALAALAREQRGVATEDAIAFGLLLEQLDLGTPPPAAAVEAQLADFARMTPPLRRWRLLGLRTFWVRRLSQPGWSRPLTTARFVRAFDDYVTWKTLARAEAVNSTVGIVVDSEQAWRRLLRTWRGEERRWYTPERAALAAYDAWGDTVAAARALRAADGG